MSKTWDVRFGGNNLEEMSVIYQTSDGGYILGGESQSGISGNKTQPNWDASLSTSDYWIVKTDANGNYQWDKRYGGLSDDGLNTIALTSDGGYILGGFSGSGIGGDRTQPSWGGMTTGWSNLIPWVISSGTNALAVQMMTSFVKLNKQRIMAIF